MFMDVALGGWGYRVDRRMHVRLLLGFGLKVGSVFLWVNAYSTTTKQPQLQEDITPNTTTNFHIRPYPLENSGSRPLSHRQASEGQTSSWVGDDQRIPGVVCFLHLF